MSFERAQQETPQLPWCCDDPNKLGQIVTEFCESQDRFLEPWCQKWFENFQFVYGNHDVRWSKKFGFAVDVDFLRREKTVNRKSQTDITRTVFEGLVSLVYGNMPSWDCQAADESQMQGKRFQRIVQSILDCYVERLNLASEVKTLAGIFVGYGICATKVDWDVTTGRIIDQPVVKQEIVPVFTTEVRENEPFGLLEVPTQALDSSGQPLYEKRIVNVTDSSGKPLTQKKWTGDVRVTSLTPFEYRRENMNSGPHKSKWFQHIRLMDFDDYLAEYENMDGRTRYFSLVKPGIFTQQAFQFGIKQYMRMAFVTPGNLADSRRGGIYMADNELKRTKVVVVEHYDKPNPEKWPDGRKLVIVNGYCTHVTKPQYRTNKIDGWHPFSEATWLTMAPSNMPTGPLNTITSKNKELDFIDSLIDTSSLRNMGSMLLVKAASGIDTQKIFAEPGQIIETSDVMNSARWLRDDQPIPPITKDLREMKKEDIYDQSGAGDAIRGDRSKGVSSGYAQKQMEEREQKRLTSPRESLERCVSSTGEKVVACLKAHCNQEDGTHGLDPDVYGFLIRTAAGEFSKADIPAFLQTPIDYGIDVKVTPGSMVYKSVASKQATLQELVKGPAGERLKDPSVLDAYVKEFGCEVLRDGSAAHRDRAEKENEKFADLGKLGPDATGVHIPIVMPWDDDDMHLQIHTIDAVKRSDDLQQNEFEIFLRDLHMETHRLQRAQKQGNLPPGTAAHVGEMMSSVQKNPSQTIGQVSQVQTQNQQVQQQQAVQQKAQVSQKQQLATNPKLPKAPGAPGPAPVNPDTPSALTPQGAPQAQQAKQLGGGQ